MPDEKAYKVPTPEFCNWFCGFFDGEGHFGIHKRKDTGRVMCALQITVRDDDELTLRRIAEELGVGKLYAGTRDVMRFQVSQVEDLLAVIVPLFEKYPLFTKKAQEFLIWKEVVRTLAENKNQPQTPEFRRRLYASLESIRKIRGYYYEKRGQGQKSASRSRARRMRTIQKALKEKEAEKARKIKEIKIRLAEKKLLAANAQASEDQQAHPSSLVDGGLLPNLE